MAAFKFFNIGKANEEIVSLESRVAQLTSENASLQQNVPQVEAAAEGIRAELTEAHAKLAQATADLATAQASIASLSKEKESAVAALANSSFSDIRTVFGVTIVENGATLNGWSTIGIPQIATADAMAASYKSGNTTASFNTGNSSYNTVTKKWEVTYNGVWSAAIEMASSNEGARMIANPSSAILSASI
jgi:predicted RNase H-like nuclease (RuvC/YqgF family)